MKKSIVILLFFAANNLSFSQIQKGKWIIGSSISTNNNTFKLNSKDQYSNNTTSSNLNLTPEFNYVVSNKFIIGVGLGYSVSTTDLTNSLPPQSSGISTAYNYKNESISGFIQAKYYVNISKNIWWSINLKSGFGKINNTYKVYPATYTVNPNLSSIDVQNSGLEPTYFQTNLTSQISFIPFQRFGFQLDIGGLNYLNYNYDKIVNLDITSNNFSFNINPSNWSLGVFYVLGKH
jgi:hypothetical protein